MIHAQPPVAVAPMSKNMPPEAPPPSSNKRRSSNPKHDESRRHSGGSANNHHPKSNKVPRNSRKEQQDTNDVPPPSELAKSPRGATRGGYRGSGSAPSSPRPSGGPRRRSRSPTRRHRSSSPKPSSNTPHPKKPQQSDAPRSPAPRSPPHQRRSRLNKSATSAASETQEHQPQHPSASKTEKPAGTGRTAFPPAPPMIAPPSMDLVDAVAQELPDYSDALSSPRRTAAPHATGKESGKAGGGVATAATGGAVRGAASGVAAPRGAKPAAPPDEAAGIVVEPAQPTTPKSTAAGGVRVVSTRSRLQGQNGSLQWAIHIDTPGGHSENRLLLVQAVEAWEEDDEDDDDDEAENNHPIPATACRKQAAPPANHAPLQPTPSLLAPRGFQDEGGDSVIDYEYNDYGYEPAIPDRPVESEQQQEEPDRRPHAASQHERIIVPGTQARRQSLQQSSQHIDPVPTMPKRQVSMMQSLDPPAQQPPAPPKAAPARSQNRQVEHQPPPPPTAAPQIVPSTKFIPRPIEYDDGHDDYSEEEEEELTFDGTFDGTIGDDTLEGSAVMPMSQYDEFEKSQTWGHTQDFSASEDEEDEKIDNEQTIDEEDEDESESRHAGYIQNYSYATSASPSKSSLRLPNASIGHDSQTQSKSAEGSLDPNNGFLPRRSKSSTKGELSMNGLTAASDSLADIQDSFAWDDENYDQGEKNPSTQTRATSHEQTKEKRQSPRNTNSFSNSLSSLPEDREYEDKRSQVKVTQRKVGVLGNVSKRSTGSSSKRRPGEGSNGDASGPIPQSSIRGARKDSSQGAVRLSVSQHQPKDQQVTPRRRVQHRPDDSNDKSSSHSGRSPDHLVPTLASQFADAFLGPNKNACQTTYSENDADTLQRSWDPETILQRSVTSVSSASESSSSVYSFGIPGLRARNRHEQGSLNPYQMPVMNESTPFVQLNLKAADGVKVIHTEDEVESKTRSSSTNESAKKVVQYPLEDKSEDGLSVDEFNADAMPPLVDMETTEARKPPSRGLSLLGSRRALASAKPEKPKQRQQPSEPIPFETPKVNNRRFLRRNNSSMKSAEKDPNGIKRPDTDIVKRFFSMANASFGSMASTGDLLDDADDDGFR